MTDPFTLDRWGRAYGGIPPETEGMTSPVRCNCGTVYDLGTVEITARYLDCTMWKTPCCRRTVDDRGETGWKSTKDYTPLYRR